jgi:hypothetical protein
MTIPEQDRRPRILQKITETVDRMRGITPPIVEDTEWNTFLETGPSYRDFVNLIQTDGVEESMKRNAIGILLAPSNIDRRDAEWMYTDYEWFNNVTEEQISYAAESIIGNMKQTKDFLAKCKYEYKNSYESTRARQALNRYNNLIPQLLGNLPQEKAEELFENFSITNPAETIFSGGNYDRYTPLIRLYKQKLDESWKERASERMHQVIQEEQRLETHPFETNKEYRLYGEILGMLSDKKNELPVSRDFFQNEIEFMINVQDENRPVVDFEKTGGVFDLLDDSEIRHQFVRRQVLTDPAYGYFRVNDSDQAETAETIFNAFRQDEELAEVINRQLENWVDKTAKQFIESRKTYKEAQQIYDRMKESTQSD